MTNEPNEPVTREVEVGELEQALRTPVGTLEFEVPAAPILSPGENLVLIHQIAGAQFFRLERRSNLNLVFYHSSPGTGTREAAIDLTTCPKCEELEIVLSWSPAAMGFSVRPRLPDVPMVLSMGIKSKVEFRVAPKCHVVKTGDEHAQVMSVRVTFGGQEMIGPSAIEAWHETERAIDILSEETTATDFRFENVKTNLSIAMLVTGLEVYCMRRFRELEGEGIAPRIEALSAAFLSKSERETGLEILAQEKNLAPLEFLINQKINFQNLDQCKKAYNKAYEIKFGEVSAIRENLEAIHTFLKYRHKIVHVSPTLAMLAKPGDADGTKEPVFANEALAKTVRETLHTFVEALHAETLKLGYAAAT